MNDYEILLMRDPERPEERQGEILTRTQELVGKLGGTWESHDTWGRRKLAYEIDHKGEGVYHLLRFSSDTAALDEVSRVLKITDGVMRHLATRRPAPHRRTSGGTSAPPAEAHRSERPERSESVPVEDPVAVAEEGEE